MSESEQILLILFLFVIAPLGFVGWVLWLTAGQDLLDEYRDARRRRRDG